VLPSTHLHDELRSHSTTPRAASPNASSIPPSFSATLLRRGSDTSASNGGIATGISGANGNSRIGAMSSGAESSRAQSPILKNPIAKSPSFIYRSTNGRFTPDPSRPTSPLAGQSIIGASISRPTTPSRVIWDTNGPADRTGHARSGSAAGVGAGVVYKPEHSRSNSLAGSIANSMAGSLSYSYDSHGFSHDGIGIRGSEGRESMDMGSQSGHGHDAQIALGINTSRGMGEGGGTGVGMGMTGMRTLERSRSLRSPPLPDSPLIDATIGMNNFTSIASVGNGLGLGITGGAGAERNGNAEGGGSMASLVEASRAIQSNQPIQRPGSAMSGFELGAPIGTGSLSFRSNPPSRMSPPAPLQNLNGRPYGHASRMSIKHSSSSSMPFALALGSPHSTAFGGLDNSSRSSLASDGSSYHSDEEVKRSGAYDLFRALEPGKSAWHDFPEDGLRGNQAQEDGRQPGHAEGKDEEVVRSLAGLGLKDFVAIQEQLLEVVRAKNEPQQPDQRTRTPSLRRRRPSVSRSMHSLTEKDAQVCFFPPLHLLQHAQLTDQSRPRLSLHHLRELSKSKPAQCLQCRSTTGFCEPMRSWTLL
jgi:hypothetical protein